jgi:type IV secretory pathway TrbD component
MRPTYRVLNKPLTLLGGDRRLMIAGMFIGLGLFLTTGSVLVGALTSLCFACLGWIMAKDPTALRLLFNAGSHRSRYDPTTRKPFDVIYYAD